MNQLRTLSRPSPSYRLLGLIGWLLVVGTPIYVVLHFIVKYW